MAWRLLCLLVLISSCEQSKAKEEPILKQEKPKITLRMIGSDGENCTPGTELSRDDCPKYHICVPSADKSTGTCMIDCGEKVDGKLIKRPDACPDTFRCMLLREPDLTPLGLFCEKPQVMREMTCSAPLDADACSEGLSCLATVSTKDSEGKPVHIRPRCKQECGPTDTCPEGELCLSASYARSQIERSKPCDIKACENNDPTCTCDKASGYECASIVSGLSVGLCVRSLGICGKPVAWASLKDFRGKTFMGENCNEMNDSRLCQSFPGDVAQANCQLLGKSGEGLCVAPCFIPTFDAKKGTSIDCPESFSCKTDIAKKLGMVVLLKVEGKPKPCSEKLCPEGKPCAECGDALCLKVGGENKGYFCGEYAGTCVAD